MSRKKRTASILLCIAVVFSFMPSFAFAEETPADGIKEAVEIDQDLEEQIQEIELSGAEEAADVQESDLPELEEIEALESDNTVFSDAKDELLGSAEGEQSADEAVAAEEEPAEDVIEISTAAQLYNVRNNLKGNYILVSDIDLTTATASGGAYYNSGKGWAPIGSTYSAPFSGTFDGNGHSVIGLKTNGNNTTYAGLFGSNTGTIKNLTLKGGQTSGNTNYSGGIAGNNRGTIDSCVNGNTVSATGTYVITAGGITGTNSGTIINCENSANVTMFAFASGSSSTSSSPVAAGIAGENNGSVEDCLNSGAVTTMGKSISSYAGGIISNGKSGSVIRSENTGIILAGNTYSTGASFSGGIVANSSGTNISECYNSGAVSANADVYAAYAGGIAGSMEQVRIENSYNSGTVISNSKGSSGYAFSGGAVGMMSDSGDDAIVNFGNEGTITSDCLYYSSSGGVAGFLSGGADSCFNIGIVAGQSDGTTSSTKIVSGGVAGIASSGNINNSFNSGYVYSYGSSNAAGMVGGICGINYVDVEQSYNSGEIGGHGTIGGIAGWNDSEIKDCYHTGTIRITNTTGYNGGIVGYNFDAGTVSNVYSVGTSSSSNYYGGTLFGYNEGATSGTLNACDLSGISRTVYRGTKAGTDLQYYDMEKNESYAGFSFSNVWKMGEEPYMLPVLKDCVFPELQKSNTIPLGLVQTYIDESGDDLEYNGDVKLPHIYSHGLLPDKHIKLSGNSVNAGPGKITVTGIAPFAGSLEIPFTIRPKALHVNVSLSKTEFIYNGTKQAPSITVSCSEGIKLTPNDYVISYSSDQKSTGTCTVTVNMKGNYTGMASSSYIIKYDPAYNGVLNTKLPKVKIQKPKAAKKSMTVKWKKLSKKQKKQVKGIEIQYSLKKNFSNPIYKKVSKNKASVKIKKLKSKKTYYVRSHTYVIKNGVKYVSKWSSVKKVKIK